MCFYSLSFFFLLKSLNCSFTFKHFNDTCLSMEDFQLWAESLVALTVLW